MKKLLLVYLVFFSVFFVTNHAVAQESLILRILESGDLHSKYPFFDDYFYSEIAFGRTIKTTSSYGLNGNVSKVSQRVRSDSSFAEYGAYSTLGFDQKHRLTLVCSGDSTTNGDWSIERFFYDESGRLLKRTLSSVRYGNFHFARYEYDKNGYLTERIDSFSSFDVTYHSKMKLTYNADYTKVSFKFTPLSNELFWSFEDGESEIRYDEKGRYVNPSMMVEYNQDGQPFSYFLDNGCGSNSALCVQVNSFYDPQGNVIEQIVHDMTVRNSEWSFSSHFKAKYNEQNLIIERQEFYDNYNGSYAIFAPETTSQSQIVVPAVVYTYSYGFDTVGNWISTHIKLNGAWYQEVQRDITYY